MLFPYLVQSTVLRTRTACTQYYAAVSVRIQPMFQTSHYFVSVQIVDALILITDISPIYSVLRILLRYIQTFITQRIYTAQHNYILTLYSVHYEQRIHNPIRYSLPLNGWWQDPGHISSARGQPNGCPTSAETERVVSLPLGFSCVFQEISPLCEGESF